MLARLDKVESLKQSHNLWLVTFSKLLSAVKLNLSSTVSQYCTLKLSVIMISIE